MCVCCSCWHVVTLVVTTSQQRVNNLPTTHTAVRVRSNMHTQTTQLAHDTHFSSLLCQREHTDTPCEKMVTNGNINTQTECNFSSLKCRLRLTYLVTHVLGKLFTHTHTHAHAHCLSTSVVRYPRYLDTYRRYLCDDTSIANITIYRGIS